MIYSYAPHNSYAYVIYNYLSVGSKCKAAFYDIVWNRLRQIVGFILEESGDLKAWKIFKLFPDEE